MEIKTAEMDMRIVDSSIELAVRALRTIPGGPYAGRFGFLADRIQEPEFSTIDYEKQRNHVKYISECADAKVIPFSSISMIYAADGKLFVPKMPIYNPLILCQEESINALLTGGRIHKINLETSNHDNGFDVLRQNFLQRLIDNNYVMDIFYLELTTKYGNPNSTLKFNREKEGRAEERGLVLHLGSDESESVESLKTWFDSLRNYEASE